MYIFFRGPLLSVVSLSPPTTATSRARRRLFWPNSLQTFRAFSSPLSSSAKSPRCPLRSPSSAGSGRATLASKESPATPQPPLNRPLLPLPPTRLSPAVEATRTVAAKTQRAITQALRLLQALASSLGHSPRSFARRLPGDQAEPARARPFLSNLASEKSQQYVLHFITPLRG